MALSYSVLNFPFCYFDAIQNEFPDRDKGVVMYRAAYENPFEPGVRKLEYNLPRSILSESRPYALVFDKVGIQTVSNQKDITYFTNQNYFTISEYKGFYSLVSVMINLLLCESRMQVRRSCPNPCRRPSICVSDENSDGVCIQITLKKKPPYIRDIFSKKYDTARLNKLYYKRGDCSCFKYYQYNIRKKFCEFKPDTCVPIDRIPPCRNFGKCQPLSDRLRPHKDVHERCLCPASWGGISCHLPRNPCADYRNNPCGEFRCERSAENAYSGFKCMCTAGYRQRSVTDPVCEEIDECVEEEPCQHGGMCTNIKPPVSEFDTAPQRYECKCIRGYTGEHCQIPPSEPSWTSWEAWSTCSRTCGIGMKERHRNCTSRGKCMGIDRERASCILLAAVCVHFLKETKTWKEVRREEAINDAFHWHEKNTNINAVFMSKVAYYVSIVFTVLCSLTFLPLISVIIALIIYHKRAMRRIAEYEKEENALGWDYD